MEGLSLEAYERDFLSRVQGAVPAGAGFRQVCEVAVKRRLGEGPGEILLRSISGAGRSDPRHFVKDVSRIFGRGSLGIYEAVLEQIAQGAEAKAPKESAYQAAVEELLAGMADSSPEKPPSREV